MKLVAGIFVFLMAVGLASVEGQKLVRSEPPVGAGNVSLDIGVVRLHFDVDMKTNGWSFCRSERGAFPPAEGDNSMPWRNSRLCELRIGKLKPGTTYVMQLNSDRKKGFCAASDGTPLPVTVVVFTTAAGGQDPLPSGKVMLRPGFRKGQALKVTQAVRRRMNIRVTRADAPQAEGQNVNIDMFAKYVLEDVYTAVEDGRPVTVRRRVKDAYVLAPDPDTRERRKNTLPCKGHAAEIQVNADGTGRVVGADRLPPGVVKELEEGSAFFTFLPGRAVAPGEQWEVTGGQLRSILSIMNAREGSIRLKLVDVKMHPGIGCEVARIEGPFSMTVLMDNNLPYKWAGKVSVEFLPGEGITLLRKIEGDMHLDSDFEANGRKQHAVGQGNMIVIEETGILVNKPGEPGRDQPLPGGRVPGEKPQVQPRRQVPELAGVSRPACPEGWQSFNNKLLGFQAYVPPGFFVRMRGRSILSVERTSGGPTAAFMLPIMPRGKTTAGRLATNFINFSSRQDKNYRARILEGGTDTRTHVAFTTEIVGAKVEGKVLTILAAGGSMAFVMGVVAPEGRLQSELPLLSRIVQGFGFTLPKGRWQKYKSPGNNFTMDVPAGWTVVTTEGRVAKNEIDWEAFNSRSPRSRAFSITPKFCTQNMMSLPLYAMRGYKVAVFQSPRQCAQASINQLFHQAPLTSVKPNPVLTRICKQLFGSLIKNLSNLQAGGFDVAVFDCLAEADVEGTKLTIGFCCAISQLNLGGGITGQYVQTDVWCKGWCAPKDRFLNDSPVLDRIQDSMAYTVSYIRRVHKAEAYRAKKLRDTWSQMNKIDKEMNQKHWETQDAISEMYGDHWSEMGGYLNKNTGRIEKMEPDAIIKNSSGEIVSREEVQAGVSPEDATVLRDAYSNDYMRGVHGRIEFY